MAEFTEGEVTINRVKIHYYRSGGKKPPFILLHGASDNGLCWGRTALALAKKYDVIMPDAQGHGLSGRVGKKFSFENHTKQVAGLTKTLGLKKPLVMGHSMGAGTAINLAIEYPALPKAILLEDPPWGMPPTPLDPAEAQKRHDEFRNYLVELSKRRVQDIVIECRKTDPHWDESERVPWAASKKQFDKHLFDFIAVNPRPPEELVAEIKTPTLLIISDHGLVNKSAAQKFAKLWKSKQPFKWVEIKGAGHNIRRDQFKAYMEAVNGFLTEIG